MAKAAAKKAAKAKASTKAVYVPLVAAMNAWYALGRLYYKRESAEWIHYASLFMCLVVYAIVVPVAVEAAVQPEGLGTYFVDIMALTMVCQFAGVFSDYVWWILVAVPLYAFYKGAGAYFSRPKAPAAEEAAPEPAAPAKEKKPKRKMMKGR